MAFKRGVHGIPFNGVSISTNWSEYKFNVSTLLVFVVREETSAKEHTSPSFWKLE